MVRYLLMAGFALNAWFSCTGGFAQDFPNRPIRLVVPSAPGGATDILARTVAEPMTEALRQPVIIENRAGAGSIVGTDFVAKAKPDGYTLLLTGVSMALNSALFRNLPYQPRDLVPVKIMAIYPFILLTRVGYPASSLDELVNYARQRPGKLTYASAGVGTPQHVFGTILLRSLGLDLIHVPYKGSAPALQDVLGGRIDITLENMSASKQFVLSGRLSGLAVTSRTRTTQFPNVPTVNETGVVKFEGESWLGIFAPASTPEAAIGKLRNTLVNIVRSPEYASRIDRDGGRTLTIPSERQFVEDEIELWTRLANRYDVHGE